MPLILNIDTASENASVSLAFEGKVLIKKVNKDQKDHAKWIHVAIDELFLTINRRISDVKAIGIVAGPGSYTGLRVGMATAKGLAYALQIPLITLNTLQIMAYAASKVIHDNVFICPMIDARRMEVFTAIYTSNLNEVLKSCAMVLEVNSFNEWLQKKKIIFFGNGSDKWQKLNVETNAIFKDILYNVEDISDLCHNSFVQNAFSTLAYSTPFYIKDFYIHQKL